ncbi:hypothetical protein [Planomonospora parontospora]|uniref:hypothetical protein n=1 Tax=Planomonospora parontospora TaxID=58119 RepID=UPI00166FEAE9|nr:hypothetical protein [Planomonospora parontospora]
MTIARVRVLNGGMPRRAWQLIHEAFEARYVTNEVCFYWLLALVSGRTRHELSEEEAARLRHSKRMLHLVGDDAWSDGVKAIHRLLESVEKPGEDIRVLLKEFNELGDTQRTLIVRHLDSFLDGPIEDQMWHHALTRAKLEQTARDRADRVWKFFEPISAKPRVRPPQPVDVPFAVWAQAVAATVVFVIATLHIGYLLAQAGRVVELLAYLLSVIGGYFGARNGAEWRFRTVRRHAKDMEYGTLQRRSSAPAGGFASKVDERFGYYFAKYVPHGVGRDIWLARTAGIRNSLRNEIVDAYRPRCFTAAAS